MPRLADIMTAGIKAGLEDKSFDNAYDAASKRRLQQEASQQKHEEGKYRDQAELDKLEKLQEYFSRTKPGSKMSVKAGDTSYSESESDPSAKGANEASKLALHAKNTLKDVEAQLDAVNRIHELLDNPSALKDKNIQVALARSYEGAGQKILQAVVSAAGGKPDAIQKGTDFVNFITGAALSGLSKDKLNAIREEASAQGRMAIEAWKDKSSLFTQTAPSIAPHSADVTAQINAYTTRGNQLSQKLADRQKAFLDQAGAASKEGNTTVPQYNPPTTTGDKVRGKLRDLFTGTPTPPPQQQPAIKPITQQQITAPFAPQNTQVAQPPQPSQTVGPPPGASFEQFQTWKRSQGK